MKLLAPGDIIDSRFRIEKKIGAGASSIVYLVEDSLDNSPKALKILLNPEGQEGSIRRFLREIKVVQTLNHPHTLPLYETGNFNGLPYHTTKFCKQGTLEDNLYELCVDLNKTIEIMRQIADAIRSLHAQNIIHRDIKASNVLVDDDGRMLVADFGLARWQSGDVTSTLNAGTPVCMAPELWNGKQASRATDIYALGILYYELLTFKKPFRGSNFGELAQAHLFTVPEPPSLISHCPAALESLIGRMLVKNPADRIATLDEVCAFLDNAFGVPHDVSFKTTKQKESPRKHLVVLLSVAVMYQCICIVYFASFGGFLNGNLSYMSFLQLNKEKSFLVNHFRSHAKGWAIGEPVNGQTRSLKWSQFATIDTKKIHPSTGLVGKLYRRFSEETFPVEYIPTHTTLRDSGVLISMTGQKDRGSFPFRFESLKSRLLPLRIGNIYPNDSNLPLGIWRFVLGGSWAFGEMYSMNSDHRGESAQEFVDSLLYRPKAISSGSFELPDDWDTALSIHEALVLRYYYYCDQGDDTLHRNLMERCSNFEEHVYARNSSGTSYGDIMQIHGVIVDSDRPGDLVFSSEPGEQKTGVQIKSARQLVISSMSLIAGEPVDEAL